jgi:hypothetical protein
MRLAYGDFIYFIKKEDHPYRAFFRRYVARLLYLDTSWGGCSGFVDCILGHHHILIHLGPIAWTPVPSVIPLRARNRFSSLASKPLRYG